MMAIILTEHFIYSFFFSLILSRVIFRYNTYSSKEQSKWFPLSITNVRGANTFPLHKPTFLPNFSSLGFYRCFPFPPRINKVRWRLYCMFEHVMRLGIFLLSSEMTDNLWLILTTSFHISFRTLVYFIVSNGLAIITVLC